MAEAPPLFFCAVGRCGKAYPTQQEADLCTPEALWPVRYPGGVIRR